MILIFGSVLPMIGWASHAGNTGKSLMLLAAKELSGDVAKIEGKDTEPMSAFRKQVAFSDWQGGPEDPESGRPFPSSVVRFPQQYLAVTCNLRKTVA